jgi:hypothetical protein
LAISQQFGNFRAASGYNPSTGFLRWIHDMPTIAAVGLPDDFVLVKIPLPYRTGDVLGYIRGERFVGFYWDRDLGPMWDDGLPVAADPTVWLAFVSVAAKLQEHYDADLGSSNSNSTHMLVWDRWRQKGYVARMESGRQFLRERVPQDL